MGFASVSSRQVEGRDPIQQHTCPSGRRPGLPFSALALLPCTTRGGAVLRVFGYTTGQAPEDPLIGDHRFDFAISFAGPDRRLAEDLRTQLTSYGYRVFYDKDFEHQLIGKHGTGFLSNVYSQESRFNVVLISRSYEGRPWPRYEREAILARDLMGEGGSWIPVLVDGHRPEWLPATRIFFNLAERPFKELVRSC